MSTFSKGLFKTTSGGGGLTPEVQEALDTKANKATSLAGYGITDAYTKTQSDGKYATAAQGAKADTAVQPAAIADMLTKTEAGTTYAKTSSLATVATSGSYNDLTDKPDAYSLPKASTTVLGGVKVDGTTITSNAEGVITAVGGGGTGGTTDYTDLTNKPQINSVELTGNKTLAALGIQAAGDYALTSAIPTKVSQLQNDSNFLTSVPAEYVTETELNGKGYLTAVPEGYVTDSELEGKGYITSAALDGYAQTADIPTATSALTNDSGFITNSVDNLTNYTLTSGLAAVATSGSYNDLEDKPTIITSYNDLTDKPSIPEAYTLPAASASVLGGVKVDGTTITATPEGVISASGSTVPDNAVTTDTEQTINAAKTFNADIILANNVFGIKAKYSGNLVGTWGGNGVQFGNTANKTTILSSVTPVVNVNGRISNMSLFKAVANKEALPEATSSANMFGFLTETSTLVFCDGTAWKQITLTDLA